MNIVILGSGREEKLWAEAILARTSDRLAGAFPGFEEMPDLSGKKDLDDALTLAGIDAVLVGGDFELRAEGLRRAAAMGLPALVLHPPGENADPYYIVSMSKRETGAIVVPCLPARLHPGIRRLDEACRSNEIGAFRELRLEKVENEEGLVDRAFPRAVDLIRALLGEIETVTATGDPPGEKPTESLQVQLRGPNARRAEIRLRKGNPEPTRLILQGSDGSLTLEFEPHRCAEATLIRKIGERIETDQLAEWNPFAAMFDVFQEICAGKSDEIQPNLEDGTRSMEIAEGVCKSLKKGRTIDLHYEPISELNTFKSIMTSSGCLVLFLTLLILPIALSGPSMGQKWTIYLAYAIPPILVGYVLLQILRLAVKSS